MNATSAFMWPVQRSAWAGQRRPTRVAFAASRPIVSPRQRGQASVEYAVVCAALAVALGIGLVDEASVLRELIEAFRAAYQKFSFALSLPT